MSRPRPLASSRLARHPRRTRRSRGHRRCPSAARSARCAARRRRPAPGRAGARRGRHSRRSGSRGHPAWSGGRDSDRAPPGRDGRRPSIQPAAVSRSTMARALDVGVLDHEQPAGAQQPLRSGDHRAGYVEAVRATAPQRQRRVVLAGPPGRGSARPRGMYGGFAHDDVDLAVELGKGGGGVAQTQVDVGGGEVALAPRRTRRVPARRRGPAPPGASRATDAAMAPDPVHRSTTTAATAVRATSRRTSASAASTTTSVSGRGMNTPGPTASVSRRKCASPVRCCSGTRSARARRRARRTPRPARRTGVRGREVRRAQPEDVRGQLTRRRAPATARRRSPGCRWPRGA